jgi:hypothetical protein
VYSVCDHFLACSACAASSGFASVGKFKPLTDFLNAACCAISMAARSPLVTFFGGPMVRKQRQEGLRKLSQLVADLLPTVDGVDDRDRLLVGLGVVAAADAYLLAWLDGELGVSRQGVVDLVTRLFDSVAAGIAISPSR